MLAPHADLAHKIEQLEATQQEHALALIAMVKEIKQLKAPRKPRIGFITDVFEQAVPLEDVQGVASPAGP